MTQTKQVSAEQLLGSLGARIDRLLTDIKSGELTASLRSEINGELQRISNEISAARARVDADVEDGKEAIAAALGAERDVWKARLEELRVQAELGRMEIRDRIKAIADRIDDLTAHVRQDIHEVEERNDISHEVESAVKKEMHTLRREIEKADELC